MSRLHPSLRATLPAFFGAVLLGGCSTLTFDYRGLAALEPETDTFEAEVAREYKAFAQFEADDMMDWIDAVHFGEKAFAAARGETPEPEDPAVWRLPDEAKAPIGEAHQRLLAVMVRGAREQAPKTAANAQARFDCWIEQQEENWQLDDIARCRNGFYAALNELEERFVLSPDSRPRTDAMPSTASMPSASSPSAEPAAQADAPGDGKTGASEAPPVRVFTVFFAFDSADLDDSALAVIKAVADGPSGSGMTALVVAGHADRAGGEAYNLTLSKRRADAVAGALLALGVPGDAVSLEALGESLPLVETADGVREPKNRRVEIKSSLQP